MVKRAGDAAWTPSYRNELARKEYVFQFLPLILLWLSGTAGGVMLGPIVCGSDVFDPNRPGMVFVSSGFSGP